MRKCFFFLVAAFIISTTPQNVLADNNFLVGEIKLFAGDVIPPGWVLCDGRLLSIKKHSKLFKVIGTNYGGDGKNIFALPDFQANSINPAQAKEKNDDITSYRSVSGKSWASKRGAKVRGKKNKIKTVHVKPDDTNTSHIYKVKYIIAVGTIKD